MRHHTFHCHDVPVMDLAVGQVRLLHVPRSILQQAFGPPHIEQLPSDEIGRAGAVVSNPVADGFDQVSGARCDVLCECVGAMVCVAFIIACDEPPKFVEERSLMLCEQ